MFLVITLGLIGTWQVFDQIYVMSQGNPAKTTLTPAFLSYRTAFRDFDYGSGAAISFVLFLIIVVLTLVQRWAHAGAAEDGRDRCPYARLRGSPATPSSSSSRWSSSTRS